MSYAHKLSDRWRLGMSLLSFSGASLDPSDDWAGRFETTEITLFTLTLMPTVAVRVTDWLSVGAGAAVTYGRFDMRVKVPDRCNTSSIRGADHQAEGYGRLGGRARRIRSHRADSRICALESSTRARPNSTWTGQTRLGSLPFSPSLELELPLARAVRTSALLGRHG